MGLLAIDGLCLAMQQALARSCALLQISVDSTGVQHIYQVRVLTNLWVFFGAVGALAECPLLLATTIMFSRGAPISRFVYFHSKFNILARQLGSCGCHLHCCDLYCRVSRNHDRYSISFSSCTQLSVAA